MRLQGSASVQCHERGSDSIRQIQSSQSHLLGARLALVLLTPALIADPIFALAEWPALLSASQSGQLQILPIWYGAPDNEALPDLLALNPFTYWGKGLGELDAKHDELAFNQLLARIRTLLAQTPTLRDQEVLLEQLFEEYHDSLLGYFRQRCPSPDLALELVQETWMRIVQGVKGSATYRGEAHPRRWLTIVAHHVWLNFIRTQSTEKRSALVGSLDHLVDPRHEPQTSLWISSEPASPENDMLAAERRRLLHEAVKTLPDRMQEVVTLYLAGEEPEEIAQRLGMSPGTVRSHLAQARQRLSAFLGEKDSR